MLTSGPAGLFGCIGRSMVAAVVLSLLSMSASAGGDEPPAAGGKIRFDLSILDHSGLHGPPGGLRALHYEFCIPDRPDAVARVRAIDASVSMQQAPGRIGCVAGELLCIGSTHQPGFRGVLAALAGLPFVARIDQAFFE